MVLRMWAGASSTVTGAMRRVIVGFGAVRVGGSWAGAPIGICGVCGRQPGGARAQRPRRQFKKSRRFKPTAPSA